MRVESFIGKRPAMNVVICIGLLTSIMAYQSCGGPQNIGSDSASLGTVDESCTAEAPWEATLPQRLTKVEYPRVIASIFGTPATFNQTVTASWGDDPRGIAGYSSESLHHSLSPFIIDEYWKSSELVAMQVIPNASAAFLTCTGSVNCAESLIRPVMRLAYRRSPSAAEINAVRGVYNDVAGAFDVRVRMMIRFVLMSPQFIFRTFEKPQDGSDIVPLSGLELASRLSFFIWGSVPDEQLLVKGETGALLEKVEIEAEIRRMLKDPRSNFLVSSFFHRWLETDLIAGTTKNATAFPGWNTALKTAMLNETTQFFKDIVDNDQDLIKIVDADYSYLNSTLANFYNINGTFTANAYSKVPLNNERKGIMTHGSLLAVTSADDHTTPVVRGKFVLERLLCSAPPPPPDNIPALPEDEDGNLNGESKIRARLAAHQQQGSTCFACHASMDPIGLGFENYNAIGEYRSQYIDGVGVNSKGKLPTGEGFDNLIDLVPVLAEDSRFGSCFVAHMSSFATGLDRTGKEYRCYNKVIAKNNVGKNFKLSDALIGIATSPEFLNRKAAQ